MPIVLDTNMKLLADRMSISSSRMVKDYGLKTVDEIIEAEAAQGNTRALTFARDLYTSPDKLINIFKLYDVENKFVIINNMDSQTRELILPMLNSEDLVMGLYFFKQDKLLEMLQDVSSEEIVRVIMSTFPLEQVILMFKEDDLAKFFQNDKLERYDVMEQLKSMPPEILIKFVEGITGEEYSLENQKNLFKSIDAMPLDKYRDFMSSIDPDVQRQLTFQLTKTNNEYLQLFENRAYTEMLGKLMKPDMIAPMIELEQETLVNMILELPDDLMSIVAAQVKTEDFANFLLDDHLDVLERAIAM